jgi:hypothetical protein
MTLELLTRPCVSCHAVCVEYDTGDAHKIPRAVRAVFPRIETGAQVCVPCDDTQHRPSEVRTFQLEAGMSR